MVRIEWQLDGFPTAVEADTIEHALEASWPSGWRHPVTGEPVTDFMEAREAIGWLVRHGPCPEFRADGWTSHEDFLVNLAACGAATVVFSGPLDR